MSGKYSAGDYIWNSQRQVSTGPQTQYGKRQMNKNNRDWSSYQLLIIAVAITAAVFFSISANSAESAPAYSKDNLSLPISNFD